jgi:septum site-determining protein MinD
MGGSVYAIAGGRGGVGKTTTASNLGVVLGQAGYDVVVVDADLALASLGRRLGVTHDPTVHDVLADEATVSDAVVEGPGGMAVLTGSRTLDAYGDADARGLGDVFGLLTIAYDVVLVDAAAGFQQAAFVVFDEADATLLLATPDDVAVADADRVASVVDETSGEVLGAAFTRADERAARQVVDRLSLDVKGVVPPHEVRDGAPIAARDPDGDAAAAYRTLAGTLPAVEADRVAPPTPDVAAADEASASPADEPTSEDAAAGAGGTPDGADASDEAGGGAADDGDATSARPSDESGPTETADEGDRSDPEPAADADDPAAGRQDGDDGASGVLDLASRQLDDDG